VHFVDRHFHAVSWQSDVAYRENLLTLSDVKAFLCFFQKSFGRFFKNDFFNLHLLSSGFHYRKGSFLSWIYACCWPIFGQWRGRQLRWHYAARAMLPVLTWVPLYHRRLCPGPRKVKQALFLVVAFSVAGR
jgi:hypothetical protein